MIELDTVLIKVASRCNIDCTYCYVYHMGDSGWSYMPSFVSPETTRAIAKALAELSQMQRRRFAVVLHGGEPLLLGKARLEDLLTSLRAALSDDYPIGIQTNGILITEPILDICAATRTNVSVSLDGPISIHDRNRLTHDRMGTFYDVMAGIERLRTHRDSAFLFSGLLAVIDPQSDPHTVYSFFKEIGTPSVDLLYRDGNHTRLPKGKESFRSVEYGFWLSRLLDIYISDPRPIRIRILDDLIKLILGGYTTKEGMGVTDFGIAIIETDGSLAKNDTLKSSFDGADRFKENWSVHTHRLTEILSTREFADYHGLQRPTSIDCRSCAELTVCGGGMALQRWSEINGYDNPSVYCADNLLLISHIRNKLAEFRLST